MRVDVRGSGRACAQACEPVVVVAPLLCAWGCGRLSLAGPSIVSAGVCCRECVCCVCELTTAQLSKRERRVTVPLIMNDRIGIEMIAGIWWVCT